MGWITGVIFLTFVLGAARLVAHFLSKQPEPTTTYGTDYRRGGHLISLLSTPVYLVLVLIITAFSSINTIQAGSVGVVYQFGSIVGQIPAGFQLTAPWQNVTTQNVKVQKYTNTGKDGDGKAIPAYVGFSSDTQDVFLWATLNYSVNESAVQALYRNVGSDWFNILIASRVSNFLKEETVKYTIANMGDNREKIRLAAKDSISAALAPYSITVNDLLIDNIDYDQGFKDSIIKKNTAIQDAEAAQNKVAQTIAEANQVNEAAKGQANAAVTLATGQAQANDLLTKSLTPAVIQWAAINKLSPNVQIALIPSGQGILLDPATLLAGGK